MQIESFLLESARRTPDKVALVAQGRRHTYAELDRRSNQLAHVLIAAGISRGDRVAIFLDNSVEAAIALFAILKAGAVFLPVNPTTKSDKLAYILGDCGATGLISHARLEPVIRGMVEPVSSLRILSLVGSTEPAAPWAGARGLDWAEASRPDGPSASHPPANRSIDIDLAMIIYTSGSTGFPKGVMMTHLNVVTAATSITTYLKNMADDIILSVLPLSFDYGLYQVLMASKMGATLVLEKSFTYPAATVQKLAEERVTGFPLLPMMAALLLHLDGWRQDRLPHLRYMTNTGQALPAEHIARIHERFPDVRLYSMYGLTECKRASYLPPEMLDRHPTSVGIAIPNTEVFVMDEDGREVAPGVVGELVVRGAHVMQGYWGKPEESAQMLRPGRLPGERWLWAGDLFRRDENGLLYFVGRRDDIIKSRGEKVSPVEIEGVLYKHPAVQDAIVVGVPDEVYGQAIKAVIVRAPGTALTEQEVLRHCANYLESIMIPQYVEFRESIPKTSSGKVNRRAVRTRGEEGGE